MYDTPYMGYPQPTPAQLARQNAFAQARALWPYTSGDSAAIPVEDVIEAAKKIEEFLNV
jgi:hypothetical protein